MALPGSGWLWVLGGSVLACVLTVCLQVMQRRSGLCMREAFDQAFGTGGGRVAAAAELFGTKSLLRLLRGTQQALAIAFALLVCFGIMFVVATAIAMTIGKGAA